MVSTKWASLAARAAFLISSPLTFHHHTDHLNLNGRQDQDQDTPSLSNTLTAVKTLQSWYDETTGQWNSTGWWNSANCLTVLADWALADSSGAYSVGIPDIMSNTFSKAQVSSPVSSVAVEKRLSSRGMPTSLYTVRDLDNRQSTTTVDGLAASAQLEGYPGFINQYYDDEGWWALAWIRSWDVTRTQGYLDMAERIFDDMKNGTDEQCGGGLWWNKDRRYKNAIANELYLSVAASLANRIPSKKEYYTEIAQDEWNWFKNSGMINSENLINDGLKFKNGKCVNNGMNTWSYNQGVILGGLVELSRALGGDESLLDTATGIARAAIKALEDDKGVIHEIDRCEPDCGDDGSQFKGIFVRNLGYLYKEVGGEDLRRTIEINARSIWENDRNGDGQLGVDWSGPPAGPDGKGPTAGTHSSALDCLVADIAV